MCAPNRFGHYIFVSIPLFYYLSVIATAICVLWKVPHWKRNKRVSMYYTSLNRNPASKRKHSNRATSPHHLSAVRSDRHVSSAVESACSLRPRRGQPRVRRAPRPSMAGGSLVGELRTGVPVVGNASSIPGGIGGRAVLGAAGPSAGKPGVPGSRAGPSAGERGTPARDPSRACGGA